MHIKYILTHPIQYHSPLIRYLVKRKINISVLYRSNVSTKKYFDPGFKKRIKWDVELLKGYSFKFLNYIGPNRIGNIFPITTDFYKKIFDDNPDIIWLHGHKNWYSIIIILLAKIFNKKVFVREESHQLSKKRKNFNRLLNFLFYKILDNFIDMYLAIGTVNKNFYLQKRLQFLFLIVTAYA